eukprot:5255430-Pleurochrysis_carterae.AAC.1
MFVMLASSSALSVVSAITVLELTVCRDAGHPGRRESARDAMSVGWTARWTRRQAGRHAGRQVDTQAETKSRPERESERG